MQRTSRELKTREENFATEYRGLQLVVSQLSSEPQPPCCFCTDKQIWRCARTGKECATFTQYYSNYDQ